MDSDLLKRLADKSLSKKEFLEKVKEDFTLLPHLLEGVHSPKAAIRYGCAKVLVDLSEGNPEKLYQYLNFFIDLLDSKYRILMWNALAIIANLTSVDEDKKFDSIFDKYYSLMSNEYMITVANVVGNSGKIAMAKPHLISKITEELLKVEELPTTPHLTEECKRVIVQQTIIALDTFFDKIEGKESVIFFVKKHRHSSREKLRMVAQNFLLKWVWKKNRSNSRSNL